MRTNVLLKDKNGNLSEIDVMCGYRFIPGSQLYIECKAYKKGNAVSLDAVSKFKEVLLLNGIPLHRGLVVTTSHFSPRATTIGVTTIAGEELLSWERASAKSSTRRRRIFYSLVLVLAAIVSAKSYG